MTALTTSEARHRIRVSGVVQGVGFRPFVHRLATGLGLSGYVGNDSDGVFIEVEGDEPTLEQFAARLHGEAPRSARIFGIASSSMVPRHEAGFRIVESHALGTPHTFVAPDIAVCADCVAEMFDPADRRWRYPFINCTNCGPRFTITRRLPYDRPHTTMDRFALCEACARRVPRPWGPPLPRPTRGLCDLRPPFVVRRSRRRHQRHRAGPCGHAACAGRRRHRRSQGTRRLPPGLRRNIGSRHSGSCACASTARASPWPSWCATWRWRTRWRGSTPRKKSCCAVRSARSCSLAKRPRHQPGRGGGARTIRPSDSCSPTRRCIISCSTRCRGTRHLACACW